MKQAVPSICPFSKRSMEAWKVQVGPLQRAGYVEASDTRAAN